MAAPTWMIGADRKTEVNTPIQLLALTGGFAEPPVMFFDYLCFETVVCGDGLEEGLALY